MDDGRRRRAGGNADAGGCVAGVVGGLINNLNYSIAVAVFLFSNSCCSVEVKVVTHDVKYFLINHLQ